jgi:hypothetical protein
LFVLQVGTDDLDQLSSDLARWWQLPFLPLLREGSLTLSPLPLILLLFSPFLHSASPDEATRHRYSTSPVKLPKTLDINTFTIKKLIRGIDFPFKLSLSIYRRHSRTMEYRTQLLMEYCTLEEGTDYSVRGSWDCRRKGGNDGTAEINSKMMKTTTKTKGESKR